MPTPTLASVLRAEADRQQLTQALLAERTGLSQPGVSGILSGRKRATIATLAAILAALGKSWGWLDRQGLRAKKEFPEK